MCIRDSCPSARGRHHAHRNRQPQQGASLSRQSRAQPRRRRAEQRRKDDPPDRGFRPAQPQRQRHHHAVQQSIQQENPSRCLLYTSYELADYIGEDSPAYALAHGQDDMNALADAAQNGRLPGPMERAAIGQKLGEVLSAYTLLTDPDYTKDSHCLLYTSRCV